VRAIAVVALFCVSGCSLMGPRRVQLSPSVQALVPHADRDHFVYIWQRNNNGRLLGSGIQVEHVTALSAPGEFEITMSEDGIASGRVHIRDDGKAIVVLGEDDLSRGIRLRYDPPLPYLESPVLSGEQQASANANVTALDGGQLLGTLRVKQVTQIAAAAPIQSQLGTYAQAVSVQMTRTIQSAGEEVVISFTMVLVPGIGEVRSEARTAVPPVLQRELACAIVAGRSIGDCQHLMQTLQEIERAGSPDSQ